MMHDSDLEDIESQLYSQVFHSNEVVEEAPTILPIENSEPMMRGRGRYFQNGSKTSTPKFQNFVLGKQSAIRNGEDRPGYYSKQYSKPHKPEISINQLVVLSSTAQGPIVCLPLTKSQRRKQKRKAKKLQVREKYRKVKRRPILPREAKNPKIQNKSEEGATQPQCDTITLSDSDDDSCVVVEKNWPVLSLNESDDEIESPEQGTNDIALKNTSNESLVDDVLFVEPTVKEVEVINLDEESEINSQKNCNAEAASTSFNEHVFNSPQSIKQIHQERKELLNTPDSCSNDFMNNSGIELNKTNFNFSLHGTDFKAGELSKTSKRSDNCETESSSSTTTDLNSLNLLKTSVFNEIDFPKDDIFHENNLESFGKFITPLRNTALRSDLQSSPTKKSTEPKHIKFPSSSDSSSSESDFDEAFDKQKEKAKNLPDLSPMQTNFEPNISVFTKKSKRLVNISSKYDFVAGNTDKSSKQKKRKSGEINEGSETGSASTSFPKKKHKKKRKVDGVNADETPVAEDEIVSGKSQEQKKKRSTHVEEKKTTSKNSVKERREEDETLEEVETQRKIDAVPGRKKSRHRSSNNEYVEEKSQDSEEVHGQRKRYSSPMEDESAPKKKGKGKKLSLQSSITNHEDISDPNNIAIEILENMKQNNKQKEISSSGSLEKTGEKDNAEFERKKLSSASIAEVSNVTAIEGGESQVSVLDGLVIIDEIFYEENTNVVVLSDDSDSKLSPLNTNADIQLINCEKSSHQEVTYKDQTSGSTVDILNSTVEEVQRLMPNDPSLWKILNTDRFPLREAFGKRCNRCREKGHMAIRCPNKVIPRCSLCGRSGHLEPRCPNKICTQCGQRSHYFTTYCVSCFKLRTHQCSICSMMGHTFDRCPDLWRRYHLTTKEGPLTIYEGPKLKPVNQLWCAGCARSGHLEFNCDFFSSLYPPTDPQIHCYDNIYSVEDTTPTNKPILENYARPPERPPPPYIQGQQHRITPRVHQEQVFNQISPRNESFSKYDQQNNVTDANRIYTFENNLPNYISFEEPPRFLPPPPFINNHNNYQNTYQQPQNEYEYQDPQPRTQRTEDDYRSKSNLDNQEINRKLPHWTKQKNSVFFSSSRESIHAFINSEMAELSKLAYLSERHPKQFKSNLFSKGQYNKKQGGYHKRLNMVLFGIYNLVDGKIHLSRLKKFRYERSTSKLSYTRRQELYISYSYIFGIQKHDGIDYNELLRRI